MVEQSLSKAASTTALSSNSLDSTSTPSSNKLSQFPSTITLSTGTAQTECKNEKACLPLQEPDVIASTKTSCTKQNQIDAASSSYHNPPYVDAPKAPPRRKKKTKIPSSSNLALTVRFFCFMSFALCFFYFSATLLQFYLERTAHQFT